MMHLNIPLTQADEGETQPASTPRAIQRREETYTYRWSAESSISEPEPLTRVTRSYDTFPFIPCVFVATDRVG